MGTDPSITIYKPIPQLSYVFQEKTVYESQGLLVFYCTCCRIIFCQYIPIFRYPLIYWISLFTLLLLHSLSYPSISLSLLPLNAAVLCWHLLVGYMLIIVHLSCCETSASVCLVVCGCMICLGGHTDVMHIQHLFFPSSSILHFPFYLPCYYLWPCSMYSMLDLVGCSSCILLWVCCNSVVLVHGCRLFV
jgi:hypothetical protein